MGFMKKSLKCEGKECGKHCNSSQWKEVLMPSGEKKALCDKCQIKVKEGQKT